MTESSEEPTERNKLVAQTLLKESDRGCVIMGAALLADALEDLLRSFFRQSPEAVGSIIDPLFGGYAPLATFSARIQLAFAIGILPEDLRSKIEIVRRLRNEFAHAWGPIDFEDAQCADRLVLLIGAEADGSSWPRARAGQVLTQPSSDTHQPNDRMVRRLALALSISEMIGYLGLLSSRAREGIDIRLLVRAREQRQPVKG